MTDVSMDPSGESGAVYSGDIVSFNWKVTAIGSGDIQGTTWFFLVVFPGNGENAIEKAVSAQNFEVNVISILGINIVVLWVTTIILATLGAILIKGKFPFSLKRRNSRDRNKNLLVLIE